MDVETTRLRPARGITLVEMITTLAVAGIALAVLAPSWSGLSDRSRITTTANQLLTHLRYARNEAVTRNGWVTLCPSDDGTGCSGDPRGWQRGYLVFVDSDGNRARSSGETLLRRQDALLPGMRLFSTDGRPAVRFRADGASWSGNTTFSICLGEDTTANRAVVLYGSGRARVDRRTPGNRPVDCT